PTMGWTMTGLDRMGRPVEVWSTIGATPPQWGGANPQGNTGVVRTAYNQTDSRLPYQIVTTTTDQNGRVVKRGADGIGRLVSVIEDPNGSGAITTYQYDAAENLISVTQPGGPFQQPNYSYDSLGRLQSVQSPETAPSGRRKTYGYYANGNLA